MKPIEFPQQNIIFAEDQEEYMSLPAFRSATTDGNVISCWKMTLMERLKILFTGKLYLSTLTFNQPLQPQLPMVHCPFIKEKVEE